MQPLQRWQSLSLAKRQAELVNLGHGAQPAHDYSELVRAPGAWGVFASTGPHFRSAIFGRDSIETAEDLLDSHQELVHNIILGVSRLQGVRTDVVSEEEPGKMHHEYRASHFAGEPVSAESLAILRDMQKVWGGAGTEEMTYYGSFDATPLFIRLVGRYMARYHDGILNEPVQRRDGSTSTIRMSVLGGAQWLADKIRAEPTGLFVYRRSNPQGLPNQAWKDSATAYINLDGSLPAFDRGIASTELQGYAYDALLAAAELGVGTFEEQADWRSMAARIQQQTLALLWMDDEHYFAQAVDFDESHQPRQIATITSTGGALLDSRLLHDLPAEQAALYAQHIAARVCSPELLTNCGIRCRAVQHWELLDFIDYHGPNAVWPKETYDIAKGLRRAGFAHLARLLEERILASIQFAGEFYEFFYVSRDGTVWYDREQAMQHFGAESPGHVLPEPEPGQAWTIAAVERIVFEKSEQLDEASSFEKQILQNLPEARSATLG